MKRALARLLAAAVVISGGALGISAGQGCADKAAPASAPEPIVIGVSLGLSGSLDAFAAPLRRSIDVAQGTINANGGVLGRQVIFDVQDDQSDEGTGIVQKVAQDFVNKRVAAVIGPIGSQQVVATQDIYAKAQIPQITPSATSTDLANIQPTNDRWLFRTTPADDFQGAAVMLFAQRTPRGLSDAGTPAADGGVPAICKAMAIVNVDNSYGNSMADVIEKNWQKRVGNPIAIRKKVDATLAANYADVVSAVLAQSPECLALICYDDVAAQFVREFKNDARYPPLVTTKGFFFIGTDGVYTDGFLKRGRADQSDSTSVNIAEGVTGTNPDTQPGTPEYNQFRTLFSAHYPLKAKEDAPAFAANTFDAAILLALAIQAAGTADDHVAVRNALLNVASGGKPYTPGQLGLAFQALRAGQDIDYKGASGNVDLEPNGNVKAGFIVWEAFRYPATEPDTTKRNTIDYRTIGRFGLDELVGQLQ